MPKQINIKELFKRYRAKVKFIDGYVDEFNKGLKTLQIQLYGLILEDYIKKFSIKDDKIVLNEKNARVLAELDKVFDKFKSQFADDFFKGTAEAMLKLNGLTSDYFKAFNLTEKTLDKLEKNLDKFRPLVGLDKKGKAIPGGFIDKLANTSASRDLIADYVRKGIEGEVFLKDFVEGFKDVVKGTPDSNGAMERYLKGYAQDAMNAQSQVVDNYAADQLGLNKFYYSGDEIDTTRPFCKERYGKIFTREEGEEWNGITWDGKIPGVDFFIQRGGFFCRHNLMWVTDEMTEEMLQANDPNI